MYYLFMVNANVVAAISTRTIALVNSGLTPVEALRQVCGAEAVDQMISQLYDELRRKAQAAR